MAKKDNRTVCEHCGKKGFKTLEKGKRYKCRHCGKVKEDHDV